MVVEIRAREICPECQGTGHVQTGARVENYERFLTCGKCRGYRFVELWVPLDDLQLSHELTIAIREKFEKLKS